VIDSTAPQTARILAVSVGKGVERPYASGPVTAIDKRPVDAVEVREPGTKRDGLGSGVVGDEVGDRRHHGGTTQAVYAYAREDLDWWEDRLGRSLAPGMFGENLTTLGIDCTHARIGERWTIGDVVLRVEGPRIPCATFAGHMGERGWVKRFTEAGRTGAYLSVVSPGVIRPDSPVTVERPDHDIDVLLAFRGWMGDLEAARRVADAGVLHPTGQEELEGLLARREGDRTA
jgi:MOSC domain-containing protein YiiM